MNFTTLSFCYIDRADSSNTHTGYKSRLVKKGAQEEDAESAVEYLERIGAVDDVAYAQMLVRHYSARGYGEARIRDELFHRGVPHENWDEALEALPDAQEIDIRNIIGCSNLRDRCVVSYSDGV